MSYLAELTLRLAAGIARLPEEVRERHAAYLTSAQRPDGGFAGRQGGSDLNYTSFGLRALAALGRLDAPIADQAAEFLAGQCGEELASIDFLSLVTSAVLVQMPTGRDVFAEAGIDVQQMMEDRFRPLRRDDGGYQGSTDQVVAAGIADDKIQQRRRCGNDAKKLHVGPEYLGPHRLGGQFANMHGGPEGDRQRQYRERSRLDGGAGFPGNPGQSQRDDGGRKQGDRIRVGQPVHESLGNSVQRR